MLYQTDRDTWRTSGTSGTISKLKELNSVDGEESKDKKRREGYIYMCARASGGEENGAKQEYCSQKFMASVFHYQ